MPVEMRARVKRASRDSVIDERTHEDSAGYVEVVAEHNEY